MHNSDIERIFLDTFISLGNDHSRLLQEDGSMDADNFKNFAKEMAEYITNYMENIRDR